MAIRLGVIGCGGMEATHQHGFGLLSARSAAAATGAPLAVADHRELLDAVDAVLIVLPHHLTRASAWSRCAVARAHLSGDKPARHRAHGRRAAPLSPTGDAPQRRRPCRGTAHHERGASRDAK
jgi:hypothetical protein